MPAESEMDEFMFQLGFNNSEIIEQKENQLKNRDHDNKTIEYRSAGGLNYIIEDM